MSACFLQASVDGLTTLSNVSKWIQMCHIFDMGIQKIKKVFSFSDMVPSEKERTMSKYQSVNILVENDKG